MTLRLRVATLNIHKGVSHLTRRLVVHELREALRELDADVVFLQEVQGANRRHSLRHAAAPKEPQHRFLAGDQWASAYGRNAVYGDGHHGNAILSRFPIVAAENEDVSAYRFERRGLLHCVVAVPGWTRDLHCVCVHLSLGERGRRRQLGALVARLEAVAARDLPLVVAGDFNDWRGRAGAILGARLGLAEASAQARGRLARTYPSFLPFLRLDRIYIRGFRVAGARVHRGAPWSLLTDHLVVSADLEAVAGPVAAGPRR